VPCASQQPLQLPGPHGAGGIIGIPGAVGVIVEVIMPGAAGALASPPEPEVPS
jgi:hypothetical protein